MKKNYLATAALLGLGSLALIIWGAWTLFEGQRGDVAIARAFLTHIAADEHPQAVALMSCTGESENEKPNILFKLAYRQAQD